MKKWDHPCQILDNLTTGCVFESWLELRSAAKEEERENSAWTRERRGRERERERG